VRAGDEGAAEVSSFIRASSVRSYLSFWKYFHNGEPTMMKTIIAIVLAFVLAAPALAVAKPHVKRVTTCTLKTSLTGTTHTTLQADDARRAVI
jgi:hypothetical protein